MQNRQKFITACRPMLMVTTGTETVTVQVIITLNSENTNNENCYTS